MNPEDAGKLELFVKNVSMDTWEADIKALFEPYGELTKCRHLYNRQVAFVEYTKHEDAVKALAVNGTELKGTNLEVMFSGDKPRPGGPTSGTAGESTTIFCGNLGFYTEEHTIRAFFESAGTVTAVRIAKDAETDRAKGFCHVEFSTPEEAAKAV